ncbi:LYR motif-containing protein [Aspergillus clavatus NRRL 1]|uniref:Mitochondrial zinc maintenance protein 1, mitochondrial n=1 Tax=Aspergillus clavatus (strain ATCC 1007 / CBS 513.65 / DSM 816 / NCTC 3887 / NRRL 1 / QM 1276 / 107) TaxID=344612 RepID=MZM1_ASPCL|nr:mitochondrial complex I protein Fmp36, putative [Aspergillus clavatus NRRL 1]A1C9A5.1 RecName: Full=Mitochondrial zinc maintenance protein 1, mitochondrial; Flags: Precursor [Aspergillus clavatus NRRL 1]EAW13429.1 mitochondrial complex I protein Fmp36, putative [Aspergillus clavatus NRRL 1]
MASQTAVAARGAYRQILRATRVAFQNDFRVLIAARQEARQQFDKHRREGIDTPMQINHAKEVADILRHNIVQGVRDGSDEASKWELRIHDDIERGDNDSIKIGGKNVKIEKACSA